MKDGRYIARIGLCGRGAVCGALKIKNCPLAARAGELSPNSALTRAGKMKNRILVWSLSAKLDGKGYTQYCRTV